MMLVVLVVLQQQELAQTVGTTAHRQVQVKVSVRLSQLVELNHPVQPQTLPVHLVLVEQATQEARRLIRVAVAVAVTTVVVALG